MSTGYEIKNPIKENAGRHIFFSKALNLYVGGHFIFMHRHKKKKPKKNKHMCPLNMTLIVI